MPRRLAQQQMTLDDLDECLKLTSSSSRALCGNWASCCYAKRLHFQPNKAMKRRRWQITCMFCNRRSAYIVCQNFLLFNLSVASKCTLCNVWMCLLVRLSFVDGNHESRADTVI